MTRFISSFGHSLVDSPSDIIINVILKILLLHLKLDYRPRRIESRSIGLARVIVCGIIITLSKIKVYLTIRQIACVCVPWSACSVVMLLIVVLEILHKDIVALMRFRFRRHFYVIWFSFICMQDLDLVDTSIFLLADTTADKECNESQDYATTDNAQEDDHLFFIF